MTDPYDWQVREQLMSTQICELDEQYEMKAADEALQVYKKTIVTTLRSAITVQMARKTVESATNSLKDLKDDFKHRITHPLEKVKVRHDDMGAMNSCKWLMEANIVNNMKLKR